MQNMIDREGDEEYLRTYMTSKDTNKPTTPTMGATMGLGSTRMLLLVATQPCWKENFVGRLASWSQLSQSASTRVSATVYKTTAPDSKKEKEQSKVKMLGERTRPCTKIDRRLAIHVRGPQTPAPGAKGKLCG